MPSDIIKVLFLGDVIGHSGSRALFVHLSTMRKTWNADFVVVNCENADNGFGITPEIANQFLSSGADVLTSGNHIWQKREILGMLETDERLLRPVNYPSGVPGKGWGVYPCKGAQIGVINLQGRIRLSNVQCPFRAGRDVIKEIRKETNCIIADFHAEDPEEKEALAWYLDGKVSLLTGTHTHVQTADERILPKGTAYITDAGMVGPRNSVIGFDSEIAVQRSLTQMPLKMQVSEGAAVLEGVFVEIDAETGRALKIERIRQNSDI